MKLREITEEQKKKYMNEVTSITTNYDTMLQSINSLLFQYGDVHYHMTHNTYTVNYAKEKKDALKVEMKNINVSALDRVIATLKDIKARYIKDIAPVTAITDTLELSFIEKELEVMKDNEIQEYYKENYLDSNIVRLIEIEWKKRNGYKNGNAMLSLPKYDTVDSITKRIEQEIKLAVGLRQVVDSMCCFEEPTTNEGTNPVMIPWNTILSEVEKRNIPTVTRVTISEIYKSIVN